MRLVLSCEHASNKVPTDVFLGIDPDVLETHAAWDPGAGTLASALSKLLNAPLISGQLSRLVADLNRSPENPESIPREAFGIVVPGNMDLSETAKAQRLAQYHTPYWSEVRAAVLERLTNDGACLHFSTHSFSPDYGSEPRNFDFGLMFDPAFPSESLLGESLQRSLEAKGFEVRINQPYSGLLDSIVNNFRRHYAAKGYVGMQVELSQRILHDQSLNDAADAIGRALAAAKPAPPP